MGRPGPFALALIFLSTAGVYYLWKVRIRGHYLAAPGEVHL